MQNIKFQLKTPRGVREVTGMAIHWLNNDPRAIPPRISGRGFPRDLMINLVGRDN